MVEPRWFLGVLSAHLCNICSSQGRPMTIFLSIEGQPTVTYRVPFAFYYNRALMGDPSYTKYIRVDICKELGPSFLVFDGKTRLQYPVDCSCSEVIYQYIPLPGWRWFAIDSCHHLVAPALTWTRKFMESIDVCRIREDVISSRFKLLFFTITLQLK